MTTRERGRSEGRARGANLTALGALTIGLSALPMGCGTTGGHAFSFEAVAFGPEVDGHALAFESGRGYAVRLTRAELHIGAVYLNLGSPTSVAADTSCILPGTYVAEVFGPVDIDLLAGEAVIFPELGKATSEGAKTAEMWLNGGAIDAEDDRTPIVSVAGVFEEDGIELPFEAEVTIGKNRLDPPSDPAAPGSHPICKERIITPIAVDFQPSEGGELAVRVDPRGWFENVDFEQLEPDADGVFRFHDDDSDQPSRALFNGIRSNAGVYTLEWND